MKSRIILSALCLIMLGQLACDNPDQRRKIKLSDERVSSGTNRQLTTTIHLEPGEQRAIAVMFFQNLTGDKNLEWLQKGLAEMLIRALSQSRHISVLSTERLFEILNRLDQADSPQEVDMEMAAIVAREANVEALLSGNITKIGDSLQINVKLHEAKDGIILKEATVGDAGLEKLFSMVDRLSQKIKTDLEVTLEQDELDKGIADISTNSIDAWRYYTEGIEYHSQLLHEKAINNFEKAIALDSNFVAAHIRLCSQYLNMKEIKKATHIFDRLKALKKNASELEEFQIDLIDARFNQDMEVYLSLNLERVRRYPRDLEAHLSLADMYMNWHRYDKAIEYYQNALQIDPNYKLAVNQLAYCYAYANDFENSLAMLEKYKALASDEPNPYDSMGEIYSILGELEKADENFQEALEHDPSFIATHNHLANLYLDQGHYQRALEKYQKNVALTSNAAIKGRIHSQIGTTYYRLGEKSKAIEANLAGLEYFNFHYPLINRNYQILMELNSPDSARNMLEHAYRLNQKQLADSSVSRENSMQTLCMLALEHGVQLDETIRIHEQALSSAQNEMIQTRNRFFLTLLYNKAGKVEKIDNLWNDILPSHLLNVFKHIRNFSYGNLWKFYFMFNQIYVRYLESGLKNYEILILFAQDQELKSIEMIFRIFMADLLFSDAKPEEGARQLQIAGTPHESTWMILGPFDNQNGFNKKFIAENNFEASRKKAANAGNLTWQPANDGQRDSFINLMNIFDHQNWSVAYGFLYIKSPDARDIQFRLGTNEAARLWLNDEEIWKYNSVRSAVFDGTLVRTRLKAGMNKVLIKVCNRGGEWGYYFRVTDAEGNGFDDIEFISAGQNPS